MLKSQLSVETLGRVWDLSDIDNDGCLDLQEFILVSIRSLRIDCIRPFTVLFRY